MPTNFVEVKVPVPYGQISTKVWGTLRPDSVKCIAIHGWMDCAGSFDRLIPMLDDRFYIVAIDLPGHGFSTHLPLGCPYVDQTWSIALRQVIDHFNFKEVTLMGHSMGASISFWFASVFPETVERIISLDQVKPTTFPSKDMGNEMGNSIKQFLELDKKCEEKLPVFRYDAAITVLIMAHEGYGKLSRDGALCLLKRSTKTASEGNGVVFTRDNRLNAMLANKADIHILKNYYSNIKCEMIIFRGKNGLVNLQNVEVREVVDVYKKSCKQFKLIEVEGDHYVHLTHPERIAGMINSFCFSAKGQEKEANGTNGVIEITNNVNGLKIK